MRRTLPTLALTSILAGGCAVKTADYNQNTLDQARSPKLYERLSETKTDFNNMNYATEQREYTGDLESFARYLESNLGQLPFVKSKVHYLESGNLTSQNLDTRGILNHAVFPLYKIASSTPENQSPYMVVIGNSDSNFASSRSAGNQLSTRTGILGATSYVPGGIEVKVLKTTGINNFNRTESYQIDVSFGKDTRQVMESRDNLMALDSLTNGLIWGAITFNPIVGAAAASPELIDGVWAYFEGSKAPRNSHTKNVSFSQDKLKFNSAMWTVKETAQNNARDLILGNSNSGELFGWVIANNAREINIFPEENRISFSVDNVGSNYILGLAHQLAKSAPMAALTRVELDRRQSSKDSSSQDTTSQHSPSNGGRQTSSPPNNNGGTPGFTGGQSGGVGGTPGFTGGQSGGVGGTSGFSGNQSGGSGGK